MRFRQMANISDEILDGVVTHTVNLLRVAAGQRKDVLAMLEKLETALLNDLQETTGKSAFTAARLKALLAQTTKTITTAYDAIASNNNKALSKIAALEATKLVNVTNQALGVAINSVGMSPEQLAAIAGKTLINGKYPKEHWDDQSDLLKGKFSTAMREGMLKGESIDKLAQRVRGTKEKAYTDGIMVASKAQATALVRTSVLTVANQSKIDTILNNLDINKGIQWVSTLDNRTTPICRALDGLQWTVPDFTPVGHNKAFPGPTAHWGCRSTQIPITRSWKELAGPGAKFATTDGEAGNVEELLQKRLQEMGMSAEQAAKVKADTRASMDGQVAAKTTFEDWLNKKPAEFQDQLLGPQRAAMWRDGSVTIAEMTDQDNRPLTISELKALVAANTNIAPPKEGENGLSLMERKLLEQSMVAGAETKDVLTHFVDGLTGQRVTFAGTSPTADDLAKIKLFKKLQVLQNSLAPGEVWGAQQFSLFGHLANFEKASIVGPTGRVFSVTVKPGTVFDEAAAKDVLDKFKALKNTKTIPQTQQKFTSAAAANGTLKTALSPAGAVALPPKTFNQVFEDLVTKPAPFFDAELDTAKKLADAAKAAEQQAAWEKTKALDDVAAEKRAAEVAANAEATTARQAANKALAAKEEAEALAQKLAAEVEAKNAEASKEINAVLADPTGKQLLAKNIGKALAENPGAQTHEILAIAKEQAAIGQAKATAAAALSGYKKKILEGKEPTPAQKKALAGLDPDGQAKFLASVEAAKLAAEKKAADAAAVVAANEAAAKVAVADSKPTVPLSGTATAKPLPEPKGFPADPTNLEVVNAHIGGSTGAQLVKDKDGNLYVRKTGASPDHIREEAYADSIYRALGVEVPEFRLYETATGPVKLAKFVEGKQLGTWLKTAKPKEREAVLEKLRRGFTADALLGNWDVAGTGMDNILVRPDGIPVRIDNGGSLRFRATGPKKTADQWNEFATELWTMRGLQLSARDVGKGQTESTTLFGGMSIFDIARQIRVINSSAFATAPHEVRQVLEQRLFHLQALATRALDFEATKWVAPIADSVARHSMGLREKGVVQRMVKTLKGSGGSQLVDENGKLFDELRSTRGPGATGPIDDPYAQTFLQAIISINAHAKKGGQTFANESKVKAVSGLWTQLTLEAAGKDPGKAELAKYYLKNWLEPIEAAQKKFKEGKLVAGKEVLPMFDATAGTKIVQQHKAPGTLQPVKPAQSVTADVADYFAAEQVNAQLIASWMSGQGGSSWNPAALPIKYWAGKNHGTGLYWWGKKGIESAKAEYDKAVKMAGSEANLDRIFSAWVAYTQEILTNTAMPNKDDARRLVRLIRTEEDTVLSENKITVGKYGGVHVMKKGASESHSIMQITRVFGAETTVQAVPFSEIYGMYITERPAYPGATAALPVFYGDGENEFVGNSSGIPFVYVGQASSTGGPLMKGSDEWKQRLVPGFDAGPDASKWGVPIDWWKAL